MVYPAQSDIHGNTVGDVNNKVKGSLANNNGIEDLPFFARFISFCERASKTDWHEANAGNASYRLTAQEVEQCRPFFVSKGANLNAGEGTDTNSDSNASANTSAQADANTSEGACKGVNLNRSKGADTNWKPLPEPLPELSSTFFLITGSGKHFYNIPLYPKDCCGIIEINSQGNAYSIVWGLVNQGKPTSELPTHLKIHALRLKISNGTNRVIYHAHPTNVITLTQLMHLTPQSLSQMMWQSMAECVVMFPRGIGVIPFTASGTNEIAQKTTPLMEDFPLVVWPCHGAICAGESFDEAFGLMHTLDKAAGIQIQLRLLGKSEKDAPYSLTNQDIIQTAENFQLPLNTSLLVEK
ncbi:MAG: rhamnulose-1-phosphate aldolase [Anaerotardibacter sp.]